MHTEYVTIKTTRNNNFVQQGLPLGMRYHGADYGENVWDTYWYEKNLFGDVISVYSDSGYKVLSYSYDAFGNYSVSGNLDSTANSNPFKYRGYYYDNDLGLYCVGTRYYDANIGRWISADKFVSTGQGLTSYNMYAYCGNNPVMLSDHNGEFPFLIVGILVVSAVVGGILGYNSDVKIGESAKGNIPEADKSITDYEENEDNELSTGDRIKNTVIGTGLGIAVGGTALIVVGTGVSLGVGSATASVKLLGATGLQTVASGALAYNVLPILMAPFLDIEAEALDLS